MNAASKSARWTEIEAFLRTVGRAGLRIAPLAGDASPRRYYRVGERDDRPTAVLMDAPPETGEEVLRFAAITLHLLDLGLSAPDILSHDLPRGLLLLEDLGDALFAREIARRPSLECPCYEAAVDLLCAVHRFEPPEHFNFEGKRIPLPAYDNGPLWEEASLLTSWWLPTATGKSPGEDQVAEFRQLLLDACSEAAAHPRTLVLRDYHAENLIWLPQRSGVGRVGLLDYQDALAGHPAYDLVSLLEDARRDTSHALQYTMIDHYLEKSNAAGGSRNEFRRGYAALGAQRNLKIIGIFARLCLRDRKPDYLGLIPRVWRHLQHDLAHPALAPLRRWVKRHVPTPEPGILERFRGAQSHE